MIRRSTKIALEIFAGLLTIFAVVVAVVVWRLSSGPVELNFLNPTLAAGINEMLEGNRIEIGRTTLIWRGETDSIALDASDLRLFNPSGEDVVDLPDLSMELSLRALLQGTAAPTYIRMTGAHIRLVRTRDGSFRLGSGSAQDQLGGDAEEHFTEELPALLDRIMATANPDNALSFLRAARLVDGKLTIEDERLGFQWEAPMPLVQLLRTQRGLSGEALLGIGPQSDLAQIRLNLDYQHASKKINLAGFFSDLRVIDLVPLIGDLGPVSGLAIPFRGSLSLTMGVEGKMDEAKLDVTGGAGDLKIPGLIEPGLPLQKMAMSAVLSGEGRELELSQASFHFGTADEAGPVLSLGGSVHGPESVFSGPLNIDAKLALKNLAIGQLPDFWPAEAAVDAREWVLANVRAGSVGQANAHAVLTWPDLTKGEPVLESLAGEIAYEGLEVHYLDSLPPAVGVSGTGTFDQDVFDFAVTAGSVSLGPAAPMEVSSASLKISNLSAVVPPNDIQDLDLEMRTRGPIPTALAILGSERLDLLSGLGVKAADSTGQVTAVSKLSFPLLADLTIEQVQIQSTAKTTDLGLPKFLFGQDVSDGDLELVVDKTQMQVDGTLKLGGVAGAVTWAEKFTDTAALRTDVVVKVPSIDEGERAKFGLDFGDRLTGPLGLNVVLKVAPDDLGKAFVAADLTRARLELPGLDWVKKASTKGSAHVTVELKDYQPTAYNDIDLNAGHIKAKGRALPRDDGRGIASAFFDHVSDGVSTLEGVSLKVGEDDIEVTVAGGSLDASHLLKGGAEEGENGGEAHHEVPEDSLVVEAKSLKEVYFAPGRSLQNVTAKMRRTPDGWQRIYLRGKLPQSLWSPEPKKDDQTASQPRKEETDPTVTPDETPEPQTPAEREIVFDLGPTLSGQRLTVETPDLGAALRALNLNDSLDGGALKVTGEAGGPVPEHPMTGKIHVSEFVLKEAPVMAKLLTVGSLTGIVDTLQGEGIAFSEFQGDYTIKGDDLKLSMVRTHGPALGLTAKGDINLDSEALDLRGTLIPAYTINNILGEIPLIGDFLIGGEGEGLIGLTYSISGSIENPDISVNPLSALTPGFLRGLFTLGDDGDSDQVGAFPDDHDDSRLEK